MSREGEQRLRAGLRRFRVVKRADTRRKSAGRWWPSLTPAQVSGLLGVGVTLALLLWDQVKKRLGWQ